MNESIVSDTHNEKVVKQSEKVLLYGAPKSGKTTYIVDKVKQIIAEHSGEYVLVIVPDQFKLETEKLFAEVLGGALLFVKITSFSKLAERLLNESGMERLTPISGMGKQLLVKDILRAKRDELRYFGFHERKQSFIAELVRILGQMSEEFVIPDALNGKHIADKLHDMNLLYREYSAKLQHAESEDAKYVNDERFVRLASDCVKTSGFIKNSYIFVDNYDFFTPNERVFFDELTTYSLGTHIAIEYEENANTSVNENPVAGKYSVYGFTKRLVDSLPAGFSRLHCPSRGCSVVGGLSEELSAMEPEPSALEKFSAGLFVQDVALISEGARAVEVLDASTRLEEVEKVADKIHSMIFGTEAVKPSEIAVVCPVLSDYEGAIAHVFNEYHIPYFVDSNRSFACNPLADFIDGLLDYQVNRHSFEPILKMLRSGVFPLPDNDALLARVLTYQEEFSKKTVEEYIEKYRKRQAVEAEEGCLDQECVEQGRVDVAKAEDTLLASLFQVLHQLDLTKYVEGRRMLGERFTLEQFAKALYELLIQPFAVGRRVDENSSKDEFWGFVDDLRRQCFQDSVSRDELSTGGMSVKEKCENHSFVTGIINAEATDEKDYGAKIWDALMSILEELCVLSSIAEPQDFSSVRALINSGFSRYAIGRVPHYREYVDVAPVGRARALNLKYIFVLGALRRDLPQSTSNQVVFHVEEQALLQEHMGVDAFVHFLEDREKEAFHLHMLLVSPSKKLYLSYPVDKGYPSVVIEMLREAREVQGEGKFGVVDKTDFREHDAVLDLPESREETDEESTGKCLESEVESFDNAEEGDPSFTNVSTTISNFDAYLKRLPATKHRKRGERKADIRLSATAIMKYLRCPFCFLIGEIVRPVELRKRRLGALETGNIVHKVLEEYVRRHHLSEPSSDQCMMSADSEFFHSLQSASSIKELAERVDKAYSMIRQRIERIVREMSYIEQHRMPDFRKNPLYYERFVDAGALFASALEYQVAAGDFSVYGAEHRISYYEQREGLSVHFVGKMDRIDVAYSGDQRYYRIIDYKTGSVGETIADIEEHNYIQLAFYMNALRTMESMNLPVFSDVWKNRSALSKNAGVLENEEALGNEDVSQNAGITDHANHCSICSGMYIFRAKDRYVEPKKGMEELLRCQRYPLLGPTLYANVSRRLQGKFGELSDTVVKNFDLSGRSYNRNKFYVHDFGQSVEVENGTSDVCVDEKTKDLVSDQYLMDLVDEYIETTVQGVKRGEFPVTYDENTCRYCKMMGLTDENK